MFRYSPLPIDAYVIPSFASSEAGFIRGLGAEPEAKAIWNLFWLSNPTIDTLPGAKEPWRNHTPTPGSLSAVVLDVRQREDLEQFLLAHPVCFINWFDRQGYKAYDNYRRFGYDWVETVILRAEDAALRLTPGLPDVRADRDGIHIVERKAGAT